MLFHYFLPFPRQENPAGLWSFRFRLACVNFEKHGMSDSKRHSRGAANRTRGAQASEGAGWRAWLLSACVAGVVGAAYFGYLKSGKPSECAGCHRQIWETYRRTGMGRSFAKPDADVVEDFSKSNTYYHKESDRHYTMYRKDGMFYQRRYQIGLDGQETNIVEKQIDFVMGSGNHSRTYLYRRAQTAVSLSCRSAGTRKKADIGR